MLFKLTLVYTLTGEFKSQIKPVVLLRLVLTTLEIQSSRESTIWICSASHSGNEQYTHSPIPLDPNINQSHQCIWYKRCCFTDRIWQWSYLLVSSAGLDMSPLESFWLVVVIQLSAVILFSRTLGAAPRVGPFPLLVARPDSFLDVGLDFQVSNKGQHFTI